MQERSPAILGVCRIGVRLPGHLQERSHAIREWFLQEQSPAIRLGGKGGSHQDLDLSYDLIDSRADQIHVSNELNAFTMRVELFL